MKYIVTVVIRGESRIYTFKTEQEQLDFISELNSFNDPEISWAKSITTYDFEEDS